MSTYIDRQTAKVDDIELLTSQPPDGWSTSAGGIEVTSLCTDTVVGGYTNICVILWDGAILQLEKCFHNYPNASVQMCFECVLDYSFILYELRYYQTSPYTVYSGSKVSDMKYFWQIYLHCFYLEINDLPVVSIFSSSHTHTLWFHRICMFVFAGLWDASLSVGLSSTKYASSWQLCSAPDTVEIWLLDHGMKTNRVLCGPWEQVTISGFTLCSPKNTQKRCGFC